MYFAWFWHFYVCARVCVYVCVFPSKLRNFATKKKHPTQITQDSGIGMKSHSSMDLQSHETMELTPKCPENTPPPSLQSQVNTTEAVTAATDTTTNTATTPTTTIITTAEAETRENTLPKLKRKGSKIISIEKCEYNNVMSIKQIIKRPLFILLCLYFATHFAHLSWYLGTALNQLEIMGDYNRIYVRGLAIVFACGGFMTPISGF